MTSAWIQTEFIDYFDAIPKIELHCHVEGTLRPQTAYELGMKNNTPVPPRMAVRRDQPRGSVTHYGSLNDFLDDFWKGQALLKDEGDWERLAYESIIDGAAVGLKYREMFFTPARHMDEGQKLSSIVRGLTKGLEQAEAETGVRAMLIADMDRAYGPQAGQQMVDELLAPVPGDDDRVIGIGMDSTELGVNPTDYRSCFDVARARGLRTTAHAGEDTPPDNIRQVVNMNVERIDHGLSVLQDPSLAEMVLERHIPFTVCPTSNQLIANKVSDQREHPIHDMWTYNFLLSLNTDDPGFTGVDLGYEYASLHASGWSYDDIHSLAVSAIAGTWLDDSEKRRMTAAFIASYPADPE